MDDPHIQRRPGRENCLLSLLADTAREVRDVTTRGGEDLHGTRMAKRRLSNRGEEGREGGAEFDGGETERESEADAGEGEAGGGGGGGMPRASGTEGDSQLSHPPGRERGSGEGGEVWKRLLGVLRDLSGDLTKRVSAWRETLRGTAHMLGPVEGACPERACLPGTTFIPHLKGNWEINFKSREIGRAHV